MLPNGATTEMKPKQHPLECVGPSKGSTRASALGPWLLVPSLRKRLGLAELDRDQYECSVRDMLYRGQTTRPMMSMDFLESWLGTDSDGFRNTSSNQGSLTLGTAETAR